MNKTQDYRFNRAHLRNIKTVFQRETGVAPRPKKTHSDYVKPAIALLALVLCLTVGLPALAAGVPAVYELLYLVSPEAAQFFRPVRLSDENNGVRMEVLSAYVHGDTAEIFISLRDLTGDRVDGSTDLYDSYSLRRPFDSAAICRLAGFDPESGTATFLITITEWGGRNIAGDKLTFSVGRFLSHKTNYRNIAIPIDLSAVGTARETMQVEIAGGSGPDFPFGRSDSRRTFSALLPSEPIEGFPIDGVELTGIGYLDGQLHIQTAYADLLNNDNHGYFYLLDRAGNRVDLRYDFSFWGEGGWQSGLRYSESVFDMPAEELGEYTLIGDFVTSGGLTEGPWHVTFPLEQGEEGA